MRFARAAFLVLTASMALFSCRKPDSGIGLGLQPEGELIDLRTRRPVPLPGLNRADAQPISLSVSGDGGRIAVVQQREDRTELVLYRRNAAALQRLPLDPPGVPRSVSLDGSGRLLAVQVSRNGRWDVDLIRLP